MKKNCASVASLLTVHYKNNPGAPCLSLSKCQMTAERPCLLQSSSRLLGPVKFLFIGSTLSNGQGTGYIHTLTCALRPVP